MGYIGGAAIAAGATLIGSGAQIYGNAKLNKKTIKYNKEMYAMQRADALADWNMQNAYNDPSQQMSRLKAAKLNPRLVYDNGAGSNTGGVIRSTDAQGYKPIPTDYQPMAQDLGNRVMDFYDVQIKQAQIDNLKVQNDVARQDALLRAAQVVATTTTTGKTSVDTKQAELDLSQAERLKDASVEMALENLRKTKGEADYVLDNNERQAALSANTIAQGAENILKMRQDRETDLVYRKQIQQQIDNLRKDGTLKQLDIELKRLGGQPGDPLWARLIGRVINKGVKLGPTKWDEKDRKEWVDKYAPKSGYAEWKKKKFGQ